MRKRDHPSHLRQGRTRRGQEVLLDRQDDLADDEEVALEHQGVQIGVDGALDGVFNGKKAEVGLAFVDGGQDLWKRRQGHRFGFGQLRIRQKGLFGERTGRPEEPDPTRRGGVNSHCAGRIERQWMNPPFD